MVRRTDDPSFSGPLAFPMPGQRPRKLSEKLHEFITRGRFQVGDKLPPERALAESFGVSRNSVRMAIKRLAGQGLLESRQGDGTYLRSPGISGLATALLDAVHAEGHGFDQLMEFRRVLEPAIAELAAARCDAGQLDKLKIIVCDQQRALLLDGDDGKLDARFHQMLAEATGNAVFVDVIRRLNELFAHNRAPDVRLRQRRAGGVDEHLKIIDALEKRDAAACREAMLEHLAAVTEKHFLAVSRGASD